jgi:tRNA uridine 5-carboxymethylaminomethyl modification enzyme
MMSELGVAVELSPAESLSIETEVKYEGYIRREMELITKARDLEDMTIPGDLAFETVVGLSSEEREKLSLVRPRTVGQAGRVSGVNPSAVQALIVNLLARRRGDRRFKEGPSVS